MTWFRHFCPIVAAALLVAGGVAADRGAATTEAANPEANTGALKSPPVLRPSEPPDSGQITLPGAPAVTPALKTVSPLAPIAKTVPLPVKQVEDAILRTPIPQPAVPAAPPKPSPVTASLMEIGREVGIYCQKQIGRWTESDARQLLGEPTRHRPAYDEKKAVNGTIYAFRDPTNQYKELELDFDSRTGSLRTVFVYPPKLTWQDCRRRWNGPVAAADAAQGRRFYSYTNRRLDVLVDPAGQVISLGWY